LQNVASNASVPCVKKFEPKGRYDDTTTTTTITTEKFAAKKHGFRIKENRNSHPTSEQFKATTTKK